MSEYDIILLSRHKVFQLNNKTDYEYILINETLNMDKNINH
jgi:hypothetical protein